MRLLRFDAIKTGVALGETGDLVLDVGASLDAYAAGDGAGAAVLRLALPEDSGSWIPLIEQWDAARGPLQAMVGTAELGVGGLVTRPISELELAPPVPDPAARIFGLGGNFAAHLDQTLGNIMEMPASISEPRAEDSAPWGFMVLSGTYASAGQDVSPPKGIVKFDYEGEIGAVLRGPVVPGDPSSARIWGYMAWNDFSIRDHVLGLIKEDHGPMTFGLTKNFDTGNAVGPWVVVDEDVDIDDLMIELRVNGEVRQKASTADMTWSFSEVAAHASKFLTLRAGDMVLSGTPGGTAMEGGIDGPFLKDGDVTEVEVPRAGLLRNRIVFKS